MNAHAGKGDAAACERVMRDMQEAGQLPTVSTWSTLMHAHTLKGDAAACEQIMRDMRATGQEPNVVSWNTLMNMHAKKGDAAACERVMRDMRAAEQEPDVVSWNTLMSAFKQARSGDEVLSTFQNMQRSGCSHDSRTLSFLFDGLLFGLRGDRRAGALKVAELSSSLVTPSTLNHFVSTPVLRALADVGTAADVDRFWTFCEQHLRSSRQGWPGLANSKVLSDFCSRSGNRGAWARVAALLSSAGAVEGFGAGRETWAARAPAASGLGRGGRGSAAASPRVVCINWEATGSCRFGDKCRFKDGHK